MRSHLRVKTMSFFFPRERESVEEREEVVERVGDDIPTSSGMSSKKKPVVVVKKEPPDDAGAKASSSVSFAPDVKDGMDNGVYTRLEEGMETDPIVQSLMNSGDSLTAPIKTVKDKWRLLPAFLKMRGLTKQHIDSFNYFLNVDIKTIVMANNRVTCDADQQWYLEYKDIRIGQTNVDLPEAAGVSEPITPQQCRLRDMTYSAQILVDIEYTRDKPGGGGQKERVVKYNHCIGRMPIMLRCSHCELAGKSDAEMAAMGECPIDPGGYFVVRGTEKVILIQEQLSKNRIIIEKDNKGHASASVTSSTSRSKTRTMIVMKNGKFQLKHNSFTEGIPIIIVLKALGLSSDQEAVQLVGSEPQFADELAASLEEAGSVQWNSNAQRGVFTQAQALDYIGAKIKPTKFQVG